MELEGIGLANDSDLSGAPSDTRGRAAQVMAPVLVSLLLGDATDAGSPAARAWQSYYKALQVVDLTDESPT